MFSLPERISKWQMYITRETSWDPERSCFPRWVVVFIHLCHSPVLIKISEDESPLNQLPVKNFFFSLIMKTFCHKYQRIVHEKVINLSVWIKKICTLLLKLHIICSRMQRVNLHARPSIIQVGCPICCYQVCALDHVKGVLQTWIIPQSPAIIMRTLLCLPFSSHVNQIGKKV